MSYKAVTSVVGAFDVGPSPSATARLSPVHKSGTHKMPVGSKTLENQWD